MNLQKDVRLSLKIKNGVEGFNDYWYGCQISTELSVLTTKFKDLKDKIFVYNNFYTHNIEEHLSQTQTKFFTLKTVNEFNLTDAFVTTYRSEVHNIDALINDIKRRLWRREYIYVGIDLFYLLPGTFCYNKFHWMHYTFVTGYDILKREFYVLEHTAANGYRNYAIPEEQFRTALQCSDLQIKIFVNKIREDYRIKEYKMEDFVRQAERLINNLREVKGRDICLFKLTDTDYSEEYFMDLSCQELFVIMNHMKTNKHMFEQLHENEILTSQTSYEKMCYICDYLINGWNYVKISLGKLYKTSLNREENINSLNRYIKELFQYEIEMWEMFINIGKEVKKGEKTGRGL